MEQVSVVRSQHMVKKKAIHNTQKKWKDKNAVPLNQSNFSGRRLESLFPDKPNDISNYHSYILCRAYSESMVPLFTNKPQELNLKSVVLVENCGHCNQIWHKCGNWICQFGVEDL